MLGFWTRSTGREARVRARLGIAGAPEAAEDLAADGVIPVAERIAHGPRPRGPRAPAKDLVLGAEEDFGILGIGEALEPRPGAEVARRPFPDITDHARAADRRDVGR